MVYYYIQYILIKLEIYFLYLANCIKCLLHTTREKLGQFYKIFYSEFIVLKLYLQPKLILKSTCCSERIRTDEYNGKRRRKQRQEAEEKVLCT